MKLKKITHILFAIIALMITNCDSKKNSQGENFNKNINKVSKKIVNDGKHLKFFDNQHFPIEPKFQFFPTGSTRPKGWLLEIMNEDLENGVVGSLDELYPGIIKDDLYNTARRGGLEDLPDMGDLVLTGAEWETSIMWWNAETIGNWWDGFIRHAFLTNNEAAIERSRKIVKNLLDSQNEDGYIGIYKENLRYNHEGSNGELWAQTTAFRTLLAYYELTGDINVLDAVEKAMTVTMNHYGRGKKNPFNLKNEFGGASHGLMLTDVCETLFRITGNRKYQDYGVYLYGAFSIYSINRSFNDMRYTFLMQKDSLFEGHGVHTYEHLRSLINAYYSTGYPELKKALENAEHKLGYCLLPSGAGHGNEWISKMIADPSKTSVEFCSMLELRNYFGSALQKTGNIKYADQFEKLTFNGIMGFRYPDGKSIAYGKGDNCYVLDGHHHEDGIKKEDPRYKYSPTHSEPAVCCIPNYARNYSYYLDHMWLKAKDGVAATIYGPSVFTTVINNQKVEIEQITNYPFSDEIKFKIKTSKPIKFAIYFRNPEWSKDIDIRVEKAIKANIGNFRRVEKEWKNDEEFVLSFLNEIKAIEFRNGEKYFQRGPLVYAYQIEHIVKTIKKYDIKGFNDFYCYPTDNEFKELYFDEKNLSKVKYNKSTDTGFPWYKEFPNLIVWLVDGKNKMKKIKLIPMGNTVLRKVTFK